MGHVFEAELWEKHPSGCSFKLLWLHNLAKEFENERGINWNLFMKLVEIRIK